MTIRTTWRRTAVLVTVGALVLTACNSTDDPDDPGDTESSAPADDGSEMSEPDDDMTEDASGGDVTIGAGVTEEPCPDTVNADNGCIYLGSISDLTEGPFAGLGQSITAVQAAFWGRVNAEGGIGGAYDVDVTTYVRDNKYNPETHNAVYQEIKPEILALAQTLGSPTTAAIADDLAASNILAAPASWTSQLEFQDVILESGNNYCVESSNGLDYINSEMGEVTSVLAIHYPGDYGWDGAAGAKKWADANGVEFANVEVAPGAMDAGISQISAVDPDVVVLTLGSDDTQTVVGNASDQGFEGTYLGNGPSWAPDKLAGPAVEDFIAQYVNVGPWTPYDSDTPGHNAMRETFQPERYNEGMTSGWAWSYPLRAALEAAYEAGDLTREGLVAAVGNLGTVDYEGMLPEEAGNFSGTPAEQTFRQSAIAMVDPESDSGLTSVRGLEQGPTVGDFPFEQPCFVEEGFAG